MTFLIYAASYIITTIFKTFITMTNGVTYGAIPTLLIYFGAYLIGKGFCMLLPSYIPDDIQHKKDVQIKIKKEPTQELKVLIITHTGDTSYKVITEVNAKEKLSKYSDKYSNVYMYIDEENKKHIIKRYQYNNLKDYFAGRDVSILLYGCKKGRISTYEASLNKLPLSAVLKINQYNVVYYIVNYTYTPAGPDGSNSSQEETTYYKNYNLWREEANALIKTGAWICIIGGACLVILTPFIFLAYARNHY